MKINVTVDLSEFYSEEEDEISFSQQIKDSIAYSVKNQVLNEWKVKIGEEFNKAVVAEVEKQKVQLISDTLNECIASAKVKKKYSTNEMVSISEWITEELKSTQLSENNLKAYLDKFVKEATNRLGQEFKDRYDLLFASQIVSKLNEQGMLKEDVAKLLLK